MGAISVSSAEFRFGSDLVDKLPRVQTIEIAFIGRSNAGKSTLINKITGKSGLAHASSTPGKTRAINIFEVKLSLPKHKSKGLFLADLPGYGFAKISKREREKLNLLTLDYISSRVG